VSEVWRGFSAQSVVKNRLTCDRKLRLSVAGSVPLLLPTLTLTLALTRRTRTTRTRTRRRRRRRRRRRAVAHGR